MWINKAFSDIRDTLVNPRFCTKKLFLTKKIQHKLLINFDQKNRTKKMDNPDLKMIN